MTPLFGYVDVYKICLKATIILSSTFIVLLCSSLVSEQMSVAFLSISSICRHINYDDDDFSQAPKVVIFVSVSLWEHLF